MEWDSHDEVDFKGSRRQFRLGPELLPSSTAQRSKRWHPVTGVPSSNLHLSIVRLLNFVQTCIFFRTSALYCTCMFSGECTSPTRATPNLGPIVPTHDSSQAWLLPSSQGTRPSKASTYPAFLLAGPTLPYFLYDSIVILTMLVIADQDLCLCPWG